jgi:hypothetical protein
MISGGWLLTNCRGVFANMTNICCRFLILYLLYYKHYTGKSYLHDTNAIIQEHDLQFVNNQLSIGEVIYLRDHGLIRALNNGKLYLPRIAIDSKGIDVIERILNQYHMMNLSANIITYRYTQTMLVKYYNSSSTLKKEERCLKNFCHSVMYLKE